MDGSMIGLQDVVARHGANSNGKSPKAKGKNFNAKARRLKKPQRNKIQNPCAFAALRLCVEVFFSDERNEGQAGTR
jgi:hypothetical protein